MKTAKYLVWFMALGLVCSLSSMAAEKEKGEKKGGPGRTPNIEQQVKRWDKELSLTTDQKTKLQAFLDQHYRKLDELRADTGTSKDVRREKSQQIRKDYQAKLKEILTPEQYQKMEQRRKDTQKQVENDAKERHKKQQQTK